MEKATDEFLKLCKTKRKKRVKISVRIVKNTFIHAQIGNVHIFLHT